MPEQPVLTVGHSNYEADRFVDLLAGQGVEVLVDVRRFPGSRRVTWTKSEELETLLAGAGIGYVHMESLGGGGGRLRALPIAVGGCGSSRATPTT
jgi:uncharacterized protein (DUF488 family)